MRLSKWREESPRHTFILLNNLPHIDAVAVRVFKNKGAQAIILVLQALDDAQPVALAERVQRIDIAYHHMRHVEGRCLMGGLQCQVQFGIALFEDHETDGVAVFEGFCEAQHTDIKIMGLFDISDRKHCGDPAEADAVIGDGIHRGTSDLGETGRVTGGAGTLAFFPI